MARIRSLEERIMEMREKLRELQDRKRLRDLRNKVARESRNRRVGRRR